MSSFPSQPGVYSFLNDAKQILYVGKAKNLAKRVRSYLRYAQLQPRIQKLVNQATKLEFKVLRSELEALLIEAELIRLHQPPFNVLLKDDKSPIYLRITDETYPRVLTARKKELDKLSQNGKIIGPFPSSYKLKEVLQIVRKIFPWCNQAGNLEINSNQAHRPCFFYYLELCPGACVRKINPKTYQDNIKELVLFLRGNKKTVLSNLTKKMKQSAAAQQFEQAAVFRNQIKLIKEVTSQKYKLKPNMILPLFTTSEQQAALLHLRRLISIYLDIPNDYPLTRIEGYDVSNIQGKQAAVSMVTFIKGKPSKTNYRLFNIRSLDTPNDYQMLKEALMRRQHHAKWGMPNLIIIDGGKGQFRAALNVWEWTSPVISIAKNPDRLILPKSVTKTNSTRLKIDYQIIKLCQGHPVLKLVQQIRDESHRFAKKQHQRLRLRSLLAS